MALLYIKLKTCYISCYFHPSALRKAKITYNFGLSYCNRVKLLLYFQTWKALLNQNTSSPVNVFMAVPTIYAKLIEAYDKMILEGEVLPSKEEMKDMLQKKIRYTCNIFSEVSSKYYLMQKLCDYFCSFNIKTEMAKAELGV